MILITLFVLLSVLMFAEGCFLVWLFLDNWISLNLIELPPLGIAFVGFMAAYIFLAYARRIQRIGSERFAREFSKGFSQRRRERMRGRE